MSIKDDLSLIENYRNLEKSCSVKVTISHGQVLEIVVADLIKKYKASKRINDGFAPAFLIVLRFYLSEEEIAEIDEI